MLKKRLFILLLIVCFWSFFSQESIGQQFVTPHINPSIKFTENLGQWNNDILFRAQLDGGLLFLEKTGLTFNFYDKKN